MTAQQVLVCTIDSCERIPNEMLHRGPGTFSGLHISLRLAHSSQA